MYFASLVFLTTISTSISGYTATPGLAVIDAREVFEYETNYLLEYERFKNEYRDRSAVKWVQARNKKVPCKLYVGISVDDDRTQDEQFAIYWDGDCKDGYANGLGREFERGRLQNAEALALYHGKQQEPQYFVQSFPLENRVQEGDINSRYYVETTINESAHGFDIAYRYGYFGTLEDPALVTSSSPFEDVTMYTKSYPNFHYQLFDFSKDEFSQTKYAFYMLNQSQLKNGFGFEMPVTGNPRGGEYSNGNVLRAARLPEIYFARAREMFAEVTRAGQRAIDSQKQAIAVEQEYLDRICKASVAVDFIDDAEYKSICRDGEYYANLQRKMEARFAQIEDLRQRSLEQLARQELTSADIGQMDAAAGSVPAVRQVNSMQSRQNADHDLQLHQLNENLMLIRVGH